MAVKSRNQQLEDLWEKFLKRGHISSHLVDIIVHVEPLAERAGRIILDDEDASLGEIGVVLKRVPALREEAWKRFLEHSGDHYFDLHLSFVVADVPILQQEAAQMLLDRNSRDYLLLVMQKVPSLREESWQKMLELYSSAFYFGQVIICANGMERRAWNEFVKRNPTGSDLYDIVQSSPIYKYKRKAAKMLLDRNPNEEQLLSIIRNTKRYYRDRALKRLLNSGCECCTLCYIMENVPTLKDVLWKEVRFGNLEINDLVRLIEIFRDDSAAEEAFAMLLKRQPSTDTLKRLAEKIPALRPEIDDYLSEHATAGELVGYMKRAVTQQL